MDAITQIAIVARPGHFRDSLAALLKTIPHTELFLFGAVNSPAAVGADGLPDQASRTSANTSFTYPQPLPKERGVTQAQPMDPDLWVVDLSSLGAAGAPPAMSEWQPVGRCLALVEGPRQVRQARALHADLILYKSVPAGEFLWAVRLLINPGRKPQAQAVGGASLTGSEYPASLLYALEP